MALIKYCKSGKEISDQAPACPNCGYPMQSPVPSVSDDAEYDDVIAGIIVHKIITIKSLLSKL